MRTIISSLAFAAFAAAASSSTSSIAPGAVVSAVAPPGSAPSGCSPNYNGVFSFQTVNVSSSTNSTKRDLGKRGTAIGIALSNGILTDSDGRTGYIASNEQFQFDKPPQAGAIYTAGFSICPNGTLAIGDQAVWYACLSGSFYNLYSVSQGGQCHEVYFDTYALTGAATPPAPSSYTTTYYPSGTPGGASAGGASTGGSSATSAANATSAAAASSSGARNGTTTASAASTRPPTGGIGGAASTSGVSSGAPVSGQATSTSTDITNAATNLVSSTASGSAAASASASASGNVAPAMRYGGELFGLVAGALVFAI